MTDQDKKRVEEIREREAKPWEKSTCWLSCLAPELKADIKYLLSALEAAQGEAERARVLLRAAKDILQFVEAPAQHIPTNNLRIAIAQYEKALAARVQGTEGQGHEDEWIKKMAEQEDGANVCIGFPSVMPAEAQAPKQEGPTEAAPEPASAPVGVASPEAVAREIHLATCGDKSVGSICPCHLTRDLCMDCMEETDEIAAILARHFGSPGKEK